MGKIVRGPNMNYNYSLGTNEEIIPKYKKE